MANTFIQIHIHAIFAVQNRRSLIQPQWKNELFKYITGVVQKQGHKLVCINGVADHVHVLIGLRPIQSLSGLMQDVKGDSSKWINKNQLVKGKFSWQEGFGAFSYSLSQVPVVCRYIERQESHHKKETMEEEIQNFLNKFDVPFDPKYILKNIE
jgi:putative transposase